MGCFNTARYFIVAFNVLTALVGVALCGAAGYVQLQQWTLGDVETYTLFVIAAAGALMVLTSLLGMCGAVRAHKNPEKSCLGWRCGLKTYAILLILLVLAQVVAGLFVLLYAGHLSHLESDLKKHDIVDITGARKDADEVMSSIYADCCKHQNASYVARDSVQIGGTTISLQACNLITESKSLGCVGNAGENQFKESAIAFFNARLVPVGIAASSLGGIQLLLLVSACGLLRFKRSSQFEYAPEEQIGGDASYDYYVDRGRQV